MSRTDQEYISQFATIKNSKKAKQLWWYPYLLKMSNEVFIENMKQFDIIDKDKSGSLDLNELKKTKLLDNQIKLPSETIERLLRAFVLSNESEENETIDNIEYIGLISFLVECSQTFSDKDVDNSGSLELSECKKGAFDFIVKGISDLSVEILFELNGVQIRGKDERSLNRIQFVGCCAYLSQCYSIFQKTLEIDRHVLEKKKDAFTKFIEMLLVIAQK